MSNILPSQSQPAGAALSHLSDNVRRLRQARQLSQQALADRSGLSRRMILSIENQSANVSLSNLDRLAAALGISLSELIRPTDRPDNRRIEAVAWRGTTSESQGMLLGTAPATREAEMWLWSLGPGERYGSEAESGNWHEMLLVLEGRLTIEAASGRHEIAAGDFLIFSSADPYVFANVGGETVRFMRNVIL